MKLNLEDLENSIRSLVESIESYDELAKKIQLSEKNVNTLRSGVIQNFEVAYEQCGKFMKRWIENNVNPQIGIAMTRRELFRLSAENFLINDYEKWMIFHEARNITSYTYNKNSAEKSFEMAKEFIHLAKDFLAVLEKHND